MGEVITSSFDFNIPALLEDKIVISDPYENYNSRGYTTSYEINLYFKEMQLSKTLKSSEFYVLRGKIEDTLRSWESKYQRHLDNQHKHNRAERVEELNIEVREAIESLENILSYTLGIDDTVNWDVIKRKDAFRIKPNNLFGVIELPKFIVFNTYGRPTEFERIPIPSKPDFSPTPKPVIEKVKKEYGLLTKLFRSKIINAEYESRVNNWIQENKIQKEENLRKWKQEKEQNEKENLTRETVFKQAVSDFETKKHAFEQEKIRDNEELDNLKLRYQAKERRAIEEYCELVLYNSQYPDYFPQNWQLEYREENKILVVEYDLPSPNQLPKVVSYKYIKSKDEISEKSITQAARKKLFESVIYQICIRTIHELFEADVVNALNAIVFNGLVTDNNLATGVEETKIIMSVMANKDQFLDFDLSRVDPKATFKHMKGVAAASLVDLTPIPPVIQLDKTDKRFISGRNVVGKLDDTVNLAAMHWEDFEHLVRELFEKEFASNGGEVKVTQASADGGVDAIAFDPDPIRGGKIVIQAKRYTNVVGVAAVRDLYGTVMNEGATKGVLVTTSDYGKDSYEFAKDKPLALLNGSNLLSLLEKHGHRAHINIAEAKKFLNA